MITTLNACWKNQITEDELVLILKGQRDFSNFEGQMGMLFNSVSLEQIMRFAMKYDISWQQLADCYCKAKIIGSESKKFEDWIVDMGADLEEGFYKSDGWLGDLIFDDFNPQDRRHNLHQIKTNLQSGTDAHQLFLIAIDKIAHSTTIRLTIDDFPGWTEKRLSDAVYALDKARCVEFINFPNEDPYYMDFGILWDRRIYADHVRLDFHDKINAGSIKKRLDASRENKKLTKQIWVDEKEDKILF